jgi:hypothetical protein
MAKPRRGDTIELAVDDLAFGGDGVGPEIDCGCGSLRRAGGMGAPRSNPW